MEIKTIDDLIKYLEMKVQVNLESFVWVGRYITEAFQLVLEKSQELKANMEAKQSKDRELLEECAFLHMSDQTIGMIERNSPFPNHFDNSFTILTRNVQKIRKHLEENP